MKRLLSILLAVLCICCFVMTGCDDDESVTEPEPEIYATPTTADLLMDNYVLAMTRLDKDIFEMILDMNFEFFQQTEDPIITQDWYRADELIFLGNLFLGEPFVNSEGLTIDPVGDITLALDGSLGPWVLSDHPSFPSTVENPCWMRQYGGVFDVLLPIRTWEIRNDLRIFVVRTSDGDSGWLYSIRGMVEMPGSKGQQEVSWGAIRDIYR